MYRPPTVCQSLASATVKGGLGVILKLVMDGWKYVRTSILYERSGTVEVDHTGKKDVGKGLGYSRWSPFVVPDSAHICTLFPGRVTS